MVTKNLHVIGIDPGALTGWCRVTVPRQSIFGDADSEIVEWDYGIFQGDECEQAINIARYARETQSLDYKTGPALVVEAWDIAPHAKSTDPETLSPIRIGSHLVMLRYLTDLFQKGPGINWLGDSTVTFQSRTIKSSMDDDRLKSRHMYVAQDDIRDATRHALMALRRARNNPEFAEQLWPY